MSFIDQASLFLHVLAAVGLIGGGIVQVMAGARLRGATTAEGITTWAGFARSGGYLVFASAAVSLLTGGHLAGAVWGGARGGFSNPFITLGMLGLLLLAPVGPMLGGARLRRLIEKTRHRDTAGDLATLRADARSAALWGPVHSLVGLGAGFVWIMSNKPGWLLTAVILVGSFALGWLSGVLVSGRAPRRSAASHDVP